MPSKLKNKIKNIYFDNKKQKFTNANYPVSIETESELDIARGDIIALKENNIDVKSFTNSLNGFM
jgi:sulfate adenylyltransferase subunit 1 (EFTu-like GTPase family)